MSQKNCSQCNRPIPPGQEECPACRGSSSSGTAYRPYLSLSGSDCEQRTILPPETKVGRFVIKDHLGSGSVGDVYLAEDTGASEEVAIKIVQVGPNRVEDSFQQLKQEPKYHQGITDYRHVIKVKDLHFEGWEGFELLLLSMEVANGGTFRQWLQKNAVNNGRFPAKGLELFRQGCLGTKAIHDSGLAHLDLKPENLLLFNYDDGSTVVKVSDFGLFRNIDQPARQAAHDGARFLSSNSSQSPLLTQDDVLNDVFRLGMILYELLNGAEPFDGDQEKIYIKQLDAEASSDFQMTAAWVVIGKCLTENAKDRYRNVEELITDLDRVKDGDDISVDVSCPACGLVTIDTDARLCRCGASLADRFRSCPLCGYEVRLDVRTCPKCYHKIAAHYLKEHRSRQVSKLKDEDPVAAIQLLEMMLRCGAGRDEEEIIKDLRKKQSKVSNLFSQASKARSEDNLERSIEILQEILSIIPRHGQALKQIAEIKSLLTEFDQIFEKAIAAMDHAQFEKANEYLRTCLEKVPERDDIRQLLADSTRRAEQYRFYMKKTDSSVKRRKFTEAYSHILDALARAPQCREALSLKKQIVTVRERADALLDEANKLLSQARFQETRLKINGIKQLQADHEDVKEFNENLLETEEGFSHAFNNAKKAQSEGNLKEVASQAKQALGFCPNSDNANDLLQDAEESMEQAFAQIKAAKKALKEAKFDKANEQIDKVKSLWPCFEDIDKVEFELTVTRDKYPPAAGAAQVTFEAEKFSEAMEACETALSICPNSDEMINLKASIPKAQRKVEKERKLQEQKEREQERLARERHEEKMRLIATCLFFLLKAIAVLLVIALAMALIVIVGWLIYFVAIAFWEWFMGGGWKWIVGVPVGIFCLLAFIGSCDNR